jgi:hypothetical protein
MTQFRENIAHTIWEFIRGDLRTSEFEQWLYSNEKLEDLFGERLYLDLISINYNDKDDLYNSKVKLTKFVKNKFPQKCCCNELANTAVIDFGDYASEVFSTLSEVKKRGGKYWWLSVYKCQVCNQVWLFGSEDRHNDVYCLKRLNDNCFLNICENNIWPPDFDKYTSLIMLGYEAGARVRFVDPFESSLQYTIQDLAEEQPGISVTEISKLLNLDY